MASAIRFHPPTSPTLPVPPRGFPAERLHNGYRCRFKCLPRFSFRYTQARLYALPPKFLRDLARHDGDDLGRRCGRAADDHGTNSPGSAQRTAHHLSVMISPFLDQFIEMASRNFATRVGGDRRFSRSFHTSAPRIGKRASSSRQRPRGKFSPIVGAESVGFNPTKRIRRSSAFVRERHAPIDARGRLALSRSAPAAYTLG
jgi:hypothetical protein